jgi:2-dehydropantoate 2-reductase
MFPKNHITDSCVYIVSELKSPGIVEQNGEVHSMYFGGRQVPEEPLKMLENIFQNAGIDGHYSHIIEEIIWEKFIFICSVASVTTFLGKKIGAIREDNSEQKFLEQLVDEAVCVAIAAGIRIPADTYEKTLKKIREMDEDSTSSMQRDFENQRRTEYEALTQYMVKLGDKYLIDTPGFDKILNWLKVREISLKASRN